MIFHLSCFEELKILLEKNQDYSHILIPCFKLGMAFKKELPWFQGKVISFDVPKPLASFLSMAQFIEARGYRVVSLSFVFCLWMRAWYQMWDFKAGRFKGLLDAIEEEWKGPFFIDEAFKLATCIWHQKSKDLPLKKGLCLLPSILPSQMSSLILSDTSLDVALLNTSLVPKGTVYSLPNRPAHTQMHHVAQRKELCIWSPPAHSALGVLRAQFILRGHKPKNVFLLEILGKTVWHLIDQWRTQGSFDDVDGLLYHPWILKVYPMACDLAARLQKSKKEEKKNFLLVFLQKKILRLLSPLLDELKKEQKQEFSHWHGLFLTCLAEFIPQGFWNKTSKKKLQKIAHLPLNMHGLEYARAWSFFWSIEKTFYENRSGYQNVVYAPWMLALHDGPWVTLPAEEGHESLWPVLEAKAPLFLEEEMAACAVVASKKVFFQPGLRRLSLSDLGLFQKNKDLFYQRCVLKIKTNARTPAQRWGLAVHSLLESFMQKCPPHLNHTHSDLHQTMLSLWPQFFAPASPIEQHLLKEMLIDFVDKEEKKRQEESYRSYLEVAGEQTFIFPEGALTLVARADRMDCMSDGSWMIWDYKTGHMPSFKSVETLSEPQLALEAYMCKNCAFPVPQGPIRGIGFWHLSLKTGCQIKIYPKEMHGLLDVVNQSVERLLRPFVQGQYLGADAQE